MCTIALIPGPPGHLILAGNRDEMRARPRATPPLIHAGEHLRSIYPVDTGAGGTWIGVNEAGVAMTLLNNYQAGALFDTEGAPRSRGLIIPELLQMTSLEEIEDALYTRWYAHARATFPFILFAAGAANPSEALQASWSGTSLDIKRRHTPLLSISSGFDLDGVISSRTQAFHTLADDAAAGTFFTRPEALSALFAQGHPHPDAYSVAMSRDDARTVSHTRIMITPDTTRVTYYDGLPLVTSPTHHVEFSPRS